MTQRLMASGAKPMTGPLKLSDGTVSAPGLAFASGTSTGVYRTTDGIGVSISGVQVAEFTSGGMRTGSRYIGELIPYTGRTAQPLTVLPYGQTLSRATYPLLWALAQDEIANGNTFYNNGNGSTTFGIGDMRGRTFVTKDNLGGSAASRVTSTTATPDGNTIGATGGTQTHALVANEGPVHTHAVTDPGHTHGLNNVKFSQLAVATGVGLNVYLPPGSTGSGLTTDSSVTNISIQSAGLGAAHLNMQPSMVVGCLLFAGA